MEVCILTDSGDGVVCAGATGDAVAVFHAREADADAGEGGGRGGGEGGVGGVEDEGKAGRAGGACGEDDQTNDGSDREKGKNEGGYSGATAS